jgi:Fe-S cluster biosynthesis and repair protein YggX
MSSQTSWEPDFAAESAKFRKDAAAKGMCLDTYPGGGGFYVDQRTQHAWAEWIRRLVAEHWT